MAYVVKVKLSDVEKALAEVRPGHRLVAVHAYADTDPVEYTELEKSNARITAENALRGGSNIVLHRWPSYYHYRDLYFEER